VVVMIAKRLTCRGERLHLRLSRGWRSDSDSS
jgi:hypothetical protein